MNNYHEKINPNLLQEFDVVEELTPEEIEAIKGGCCFPYPPKSPEIPCTFPEGIVICPEPELPTSDSNFDPKPTPCPLLPWPRRLPRY